MPTPSLSGTSVPTPVLDDDAATSTDCPTTIAEADWLTETFWRNADLARVRDALHCGANVNAVDRDYATPLHLAAQEERDPEIILLLLDAGAYVNEKARDDLTPLHLAAQTNVNTEVIHTLLGNGARVDAYAKDNLTPLHYAAALSNNPAVVHALIGAGADIESGGRMGLTPLQYAAANNRNPAVIQALLDAGADVEAKSSFGPPPLMLAEIENNEEAIRLLSCPVGVTQTALFDTEFWRAADAAQVEEKLRCGADANAQEEYAGLTLLHIAAQYAKDPGAIQALLNAGANIDARNAYGESPLHFAALSGSSETTGVLLAAGAGVEPKDNRGRTPLHFATGGELNRSGIANDPVIPIVHQYGNLFAIRALVAAGANVDTVDEKWRTPLRYAVELRVRPEVVQALLDAGADVNAIDVNGGTPLDRARAVNNKEARRILLSEQ